MSVASNVKRTFVDAIEVAVKDFLKQRPIGADSASWADEWFVLDDFEFEVHRVKDLEIQVRAKSITGDPAKYFLIKISTPWS